MAFASLVSSPGKKVNRKNKNKFDGLHLYKGKWRVQVTLDKGFNNAEDAQRYRKSLISHIKKRPETTNNNEDVNQMQVMGDSIDQMVSPIKSQRRQNSRKRISTANSVLSTRRRMHRSRSNNAIISNSKTSSNDAPIMNEFGDYDNSHLTHSNLQDWNTGALISKMRLKRSKSSWGNRRPRNRLQPEFVRPKILRTNKYQDPDETLYHSPRSFCKQTLKANRRKQMLRKTGKDFNPKYIPLAQNPALTTILQRQTGKELLEKKLLEQSYGFLGDFRDKYTYEKTHLDIFCHQSTREHRAKNPFLANE